MTKVAIKKALSKFSIITARDRWTQRIISNLSTQNIEITPDPVFAFNQNVTCQYDKDEIISKYNLPNKYVIFSFCKQLYDKKWYSELYHSFQKEGFEIVKITHDLHSEMIFEDIRTEHEQMFSEQGIKIKALIAYKK